MIEDISQLQGLLSTKEVASLLGRSQECITDWIGRGYLSALRIGGRLWVEPSRLVADLEAMRTSGRNIPIQCPSLRPLTKEEATALNSALQPGKGKYDLLTHYQDIPITVRGCRLSTIPAEYLANGDDDLIQAEV